MVNIIISQLTDISIKPKGISLNRLKNLSKVVYFFPTFAQRKYAPIMSKTTKVLVIILAIIVGLVVVKLVWMGEAITLAMRTATEWK